MDQKEARRILSKYYEGTTTEKEESALIEYFSGENVPEELYVEREWFRNYSGIKIPDPSDDFYSRLNAVTGDDKSLIVKGSTRFLWYYRIAATVALIISGYLIVHSLNSKPAYMKDTYNDPQLAMAEVRRVLNEVSLNMKKGTEGLPALKSMGEAQSALETFKSASHTAVKSVEGLKSNFNKTRTEGKQ
jgi:hypothetical protein